MTHYKESSLLAFIKRIKQQNGLQSGGNLGRITTKFDISVIHEKAGFLSSVFATLTVQLVVVALVAYYLNKRKPAFMSQKIWFILFIIAMFVLTVVLALVPMHPVIKFCVFTLFSMLIGFLVSIATSRVSKEVVYASMGGTFAIFIAFVMLGLLLVASGINISWLGALLFFALLILIIVQIVFAFIKDPTKKRQRIFAIIGLIIFSLYVMYDTFNILQRDYFGDFVTAALDYFLDIINIFLNTLTLISNE
jgi:FtsH-binding integral membrane protein